MIQTVNSVSVWKFLIFRRLNDPCQPSAGRIDASKNETTFTTLHTSTVTLTTSVIEFQFNPQPTITNKYFRFYATASSLSSGTPGLSHLQLF